MTAPTISSQPASLSNQLPGTNVSFEVTAAVECGSLTYQWCFNGCPISDDDGSKYSGADTASLTVMDLVHPDDEGTYSVKITNIAAMTTESDGANLDICECSFHQYIVYIASSCTYLLCTLRYTHTESVYRWYRYTHSTHNFSLCPCTW